MSAILFCFSKTTGDISNWFYSCIFAFFVSSRYRRRCQVLLYARFAITLKFRKTDAESFLDTPLEIMEHFRMSIRERYTPVGFLPENPSKKKLSPLIIRYSKKRHFCRILSVEREFNRQTRLYANIDQITPLRFHRQKNPTQSNCRSNGANKYSPNINEQTLVGLRLNTKLLVSTLNFLVKRKQCFLISGNHK